MQVLQCANLREDGIKLKEGSGVASLRDECLKGTIMREGSAPNFCPPLEEGMVFGFEDEAGDEVSLEFLGLILHNDQRYGFFFVVDEESPVGSSGEVVLMEVVELDAEGQPEGFEVVEDEEVAADVYAAFREATKDLYSFL